ncbi:hypothetical protein SARC_12038 [Sphaeroforma arctica JP610]|uniref:F-actin-capping protein subunit alpha n=1 Tax=Sphaeroforma arctica JP610 TaxID=667725 RepID=A0A0L0FFA5_9EUKA|nr:hypothetical protein SARC_12038 [Sphaeroforma arctica JP610]KNC75435.1 hypothetical protein SARC_12038 [Sphaeroforma arctica JP610]|eukprot:XP_014149337.1 hypothetical protein SARC_12038 [Sphaeroforma arctica JP610]
MSYDLPNDEKVKICADFIQTGPPGQFTDVYNDVRALLGDDELLKDTAPAAAKLHRDSFLSVELPEENGKPAVRAMVTPHGNTIDSCYLEPRTQRTFSFNPISRLVESIEAAEINTDEDAEACRQAIQTAVDEYVEQYYVDGTSTVYCKQEGGCNIYTVCIESHKFSLANFWCGMWTSEYFISTENGSAEIRGKIKMRVHYFEDANIQLQAGKDVNETISSSSTDDLADKVGKYLLKCEGTYQSAVNENYIAMAGDCFKSLRRALPITKSKLDWGKIASYRVGDEISKK